MFNLLLLLKIPRFFLRCTVSETGVKSNHMLTYVNKDSWQKGKILNSRFKKNLKSTDSTLYLNQNYIFALDNIKHILKMHVKKQFYAQKG